MASHNQLGKAGEEAAVQYLIEQGYTIRHRNWRYGRKELDIVAYKDGELVVVEVKCRKSETFQRPAEAVDGRKISHIFAATDAYLRCYSLRVSVRFDVIAIVGSPGTFTIEHMKDAFRAFICY